jgi:hypothetical protein
MRHEYAPPASKRGENFERRFDMLKRIASRLRRAALPLVICAIAAAPLIAASPARADDWHGHGGGGWHGDHDWHGGPRWHGGWHGGWGGGVVIAPPVVVAPPPVVVAPYPYYYHHWVPGFYTWDGFWIPGHWV